MPGLREQPLVSFLDEVAGATPAPGGGTSAAFALALGAALVEMAARLAGDPDAAARASGARAEGLELAERELTSYAPVLDAVRMPRDDPGRTGRLQEALLQASHTPLAIAERAAEVAELGADVARRSSQSVRADAVTGVVLAEAACAAATGLVEVNLARRDEAPELERAQQARGRARRARAEAEAAPP